MAAAGPKEEAKTKTCARVQPEEERPFGKGTSGIQTAGRPDWILCLAHEGEVISDEALQAYVDLFSLPLTDAHIVAIVALFSWEPSILPMTDEKVVGEVGS